MPQGWYFMFAQSARWFDRGQQSFCFRKWEKSKNGEVALAIRSLPNPKKLKPIVGVWDPSQGWEDHPASKAAREHFQFP